MKLTNETVGYVLIVVLITLMAAGQFLGYATNTDNMLIIAGLVTALLGGKELVIQMGGQGGPTIKQSSNPPEDTTDDKQDTNGGET